MILFKILWTIDALTSLVVLYFFVVGLGDGSISSRNMGVWLIIVAFLANILLGSIWLKSHANPVLALTLLLVLAIPALFYLVYILIAMSGTQRWN